jgi:pyruvate dehydrogenase E1 component alpha subunit
MNGACRALRKATGCSRGKGGSMHNFAPDKNYWASHGNVGATRLALASPTH